MSMENILELQQVSKTFPKSNFTLKNVTFSLPLSGLILGFVRRKWKQEKLRRLVVF